MDTGRMVPAIKSGRTGQPWVELWGDWLHSVDVPERALALPLGDVGSVYHVHRFNLGTEEVSPLGQNGEHDIRHPHPQEGAQARAEGHLSDRASRPKI